MFWLVKIQRKTLIVVKEQDLLLNGNNKSFSVVYKDFVLLELNRISSHYMSYLLLFRSN